MAKCITDPVGFFWYKGYHIVHTLCIRQGSRYAHRETLPEASFYRAPIRPYMCSVILVLDAWTVVDTINACFCSQYVQPFPNLVELL